jgi:hypothetical protein
VERYIKAGRQSTKFPMLHAASPGDDLFRFRKRILVKLARMLRIRTYAPPSRR